MTTPLPPGLVGAWTRDSIAVGDAPPAEPQRVRYLQALRSYADLRLDRDGPGAACFAGTTTWAPPRASWSHDLDLEPAGTAGLDQGTLEWLADGRMRERGTWAGPDGPVPYEEVWRPLPVGDGGLVALRSDGPPARLVQVGGHRLVVVDGRAAGDGFAARYDARPSGGAWASEPGLALALGDASALPGPAELDALDDMLLVLAAGRRVELAGLAWTVTDASPFSPPKVGP